MPPNGVNDRHHAISPHNLRLFQRKWNLACFQDLLLGHTPYFQSLVDGYDMDDIQNIVSTLWLRHWYILTIQWDSLKN